MTAPDELIEVLSRRHDILRSLHDAPKERHELVDHLDDSKSTIYKGVSQLTELSLIESTPVGLQPTAFGIVALERYDELAQLTEFRSVLAALPAGAVTPTALVDAEVVTPDSRSVDRHIARIESLLRDADRIRGFSPAISRAAIPMFHRRISEDEVPAELVLSDDIVAHLQDEYPTVVDGVRSARNATLYRTTQELPFTLLLITSPDNEEFCLEPSDEGLATDSSSTTLLQEYGGPSDCSTPRSAPPSDCSRAVRGSTRDQTDTGNARDSAHPGISRSVC